MTHRKKSFEKSNIFIQADLGFWMLNEHQGVLVVPKIHAVGPPVASQWEESISSIDQSEAIIIPGVLEDVRSLVILLHHLCSVVTKADPGRVRLLQQLTGNLTNEKTVLAAILTNQRTVSIPGQSSESSPLELPSLLGQWWRPDWPRPRNSSNRTHWEHPPLLCLSVSIDQSEAGMKSIDQSEDSNISGQWEESFDHLEKSGYKLGNISTVHTHTHTHRQTLGLVELHLRS